MKTRSGKRGNGTLAVEVTNISARGFWLLLDSRELFVAFARFPWFRKAPAGAIAKVKRPSARHLHWPALDIDLEVESIEDPRRYPLISGALANKRLRGSEDRVAPRARAKVNRSADR